MSKRFVDPALSSSIWLVFLISLILQLGTPAFAQAQTQAALAEKNVLILHTLESSTPLTLETNRGLLDTLRIGGIPPANLFLESMDLRRNPGPELRKLLAEQMRLKWSHRKANMVITVYPEALEFVLNDCRDVFPNVPIIALHLPQDYMMAETGRRIIGHFPTYDITGTIDNALKLVPGTKRIYVVSGAHKIDKWLEDRARLASKKFERVEFLYLSHMTIEDILATVSKAPPGSVILYLALTQDVAGKGHTGLGLAHDLSQVSTVPVFGLFESALGYGVTGGNLISWNLIGRRAGQLVIDILKGVKTIDDVPPVLDVPSVPMFDWRELSRWNLSEAALPKGSIVINREVTFWDFKYYVLGGFAVILAQALLVIGLLVQRGRKQKAEKSLRQKTEELDQFFNVSLDILGIANTDSYFLRLNPAVERILGYTREELMARPLLEFVHPDDLEKTRKAISALGSQQKLLLFENRYRCKDGTYRWLEWSSAPVGKLIYAAARDVTERKRAELEAFEARRELTRMDRLSRMGELSASLSHELNQPLTAILGNASAALRFLRSGKLDPGELDEILQDIVKDDKRAGDIIKNLKSMVKQEEGERELISINDILDETVALFRSEAIIRNIRIEINLADALPLLHINKVQIQQVLTNLMMNAAESMAGSASAERVIVLQTAASGQGAVKVAVRDFGPGIEEQVLQRIFEPFFTTKRSGLGMGLSLSRSIIESHGGHIWAQNNPDRGSTFYFDLPGVPNFSQNPQLKMSLSSNEL